MKAQGLPLNFIILGALALLVLVVAVAFFMSGTATLTTGMTQQQLNQRCTTLCNNINSITLSTNLNITMCSGDKDDCFPSRALPIAQGYVNSTYDIPGLGQVTCDTVVPCQVRFADLTSCFIYAPTTGDIVSCKQ